MRIISLNVWFGKLEEPLIAFIKREAPTTDIFCFQEMKSSLENSQEKNLFSLMVKILPDFQGFFESSQDESDGSEDGLAVFVKRKTPIDREGDFFVYRTRNAMVRNEGRTMGKNVQFIEFPLNGKECVVANFHGLWRGKNREDTESRLEQSRKIKIFLDAIPGAKIICGDFNLNPETKSMAIVAEGMKNLVKDYGITTTRNHHFPVQNTVCDYILVDPGVNVKDFRALHDDVSDHLPLMLDFDN